MHIIQTAAGAAGSHCGVCVRDTAVARGLRARGHRVLLVPLYTPLRQEGPDEVGGARICLGGVNVFFQQYLPFARHGWFRVFDRFLDHPWFLRRIAGRAVETQPEKLGAMTVSMLAGLDGCQRREVEKFIAYLRAQPPPDVVFLTNMLLSGLAPALRDAFACPIVCNLQGGEAFIARLGAPHAAEAMELVRRNAGAISRFAATCDGYAAEAAEFLGLPREKIAVVPPCLDPELFPPRPPRPAGSPFTVGFLSRPNLDKGVDLVVRGFCEFRKSAAGGNSRLLLAGEPGGDRGRLLRELLAEAAAAGHGDRIEYRGVPDLEGKRAMLAESDVFCLPSRLKERRAVAVLEAMASGVPAVVSGNGIFPEMLAKTGGGVVLSELTPAALAATLAELHASPERLTALGQAAAAGVRRHFSAASAVAAIEAVCRELGCRNLLEPGLKNLYGKAPV